jgi:hypothetical protein
MGLAGTAVSSTSIVLYWPQADDGESAVSGYDIHRDGSFLLTHADNTYADSGLAPGSSHSYRIAARYSSGQVGPLSAALAVATDAAENPRLVRPWHLDYQGAFRLPGDAANDYSYGGTSIAFNPANGSLFVRGHDWYQLVGEVSIPAPAVVSDYAALPVAAVIQNQADITEGHLEDVGPDGGAMDGCKVGGLLVYEGRLIGTSYVYYDAGGGAKRSHFTSGLNFSTSGDFGGMYSVGTLNPGFVAGYMALVPPEWRTALGGPVLTGLDGVPIISRSSYGPTVSAFDPARLGSADPVPASNLLGYTYEHSTLGNWGNETESNPQFNQAGGSSGIVFPFGSDSLLFFGSTGTGVPCYGQGTSDASLDRSPVPGTDGQVVYVYDPVGGGKGCHSYPYVAYVWAYRAADLARVAAGTAQAWEIVPYATWELPMSFGPEGGKTLCGAAYDPATNRIFVSQYNAVGAGPLIHVYKLDLSRSR